TGGFSHTNINNTNNAWQNLPDSSDDIAKIVLFRGVCNRRFSVFFPCGSPRMSVSASVAADSGFPAHTLGYW
ncbi:hypothetical protein, partial [uncultured Alistipes sp.]